MKMDNKYKAGFGVSFIYTIQAYCKATRLKYDEEVAIRVASEVVECEPEAIKEALKEAENN